MRILLVEDNPIVQSLVKEQLIEWDYDVLTATTGEEARQILESDSPPPMVILDWVLPDAEGVEICREIRQNRLDQYTYVIMFTGRDSIEDLVIGMEAGADDYITKPLNSHALKVRLRAGKRIVDLQSALLEKQKSLMKQASRDALTGVLNHAGIIEFLRRELNQLLEENRPVSLVMGDPDDFKKVNDTYGHLAGNDVLCEVARRMSELTRSSDAVGRYGGDEFLIVLHDCRQENAMKLAERIRESISNNPIETSEGRIAVTMSIGVATSNDGKIALKEFVQKVDSALYHAKNKGKNRVESIDVTGKN